MWFLIFQDAHMFFVLWKSTCLLLHLVDKLITEETANHSQNIPNVAVLINWFYVCVHFFHDNVFLKTKQHKNDYKYSSMRLQINKQINDK